MRKRRVSFVVVLALLLVAGVAPAAAQESTTVASTAENSTNSVGSALAGDSQTRLIEYELRDGTMFVTLETTDATRVSLSAPPSSDAEKAAGYVTTGRLPAGVQKTFSVPAPDGTAWLSTSRQTENGRFTELDVSGPGLIPGPFDGADVFYAGSFSALGVALAVLYEAVTAVYGDVEGGERVA